MQQPKRRILLPTLLALALGWLAYWSVDKLLEPKPTFEVPLKPGQFAYVNLGRLMVSSSDSDVTFYQLSNGTSTTIPNGDYYSPLDRIETYNTVVADPSTLLQQDTPCYLAFSPEREPPRHYRYVTFNPTEGRFRRFHGFAEDDQFSRLFGNMHVRSRACVIRRPLLFQAVLNNALMPYQSPASIMLDYVGMSHPFACPLLHTVVSIPDKRKISQFILDRGWGDAEVSISREGRYVVCIRGENSFTKEAFEGLSFGCFWDVQTSQWLQQIPETSRTSKSGLLSSFINDDVFVGQFQQSVHPNDSQAYSLLAMKSGKLLDHLHGVTAGYFSMRQIIHDAEGILWYLAQVHPPPETTYQLRKTSDMKSVETVSEKTWSTNFVGVALSQGLQSIVPVDGQTGFTKWIQARLGKYSFYQQLEPWIKRPCVDLYDWNSRTLHHLWSKDVKWQLSENGEYLLIVHRNVIDRNKFEELQAQVFQMPLLIHSPWWSLVTGTIVAALVYVLCWRWQTRRLLRPTP